MKPFATIMVLCLAVISISSSAQSAAKVPANDGWAPFQFLLGNWSGVGSGKPGEATAGSSSFSYDIDKHIIVRRNRAEYPAKPGEMKGWVHEDLLIIYRQPGQEAFQAMYFDNEGHVINYSISFPSKQSAVVLDSESSGKGPLFRLVYELRKDGSLSVEFLVGPTEKELRSYVTGLLKRTS